MSAVVDSTVRPYADAAHRYYAAGWLGVLPVGTRPRLKKAPPSGYTGHDGGWPTIEDLEAWQRDHPDVNIALRLPRGVVGIDVDAYDGKRGLDTMKAGAAAHGRLPDTWVSTSREDGVSGIRLFRVPEDVEFPGQLNHPMESGVSGVELIQFTYRYMVTAPSVHPEGRVYRWTAPSGAVGGFPMVNDLPELPAGWLAHLKGTCTCFATVVFTVKASSDPVANALAEARAALHGGQSRHEAVLKPVLALVGFRNRGAPGAAEALDELRAEFIAAVTTPGRGDTRSSREAEGEWRRMTTEGKAATAGAGLPAWEEPGARFAAQLEDDDEPASDEAPPHLVRQSRAAWYFARYEGDRLRYDHGRGRWLVWAGHRWRPDDDGKVRRRWLKVLRVRYGQALNINDEDTRKRTLTSVSDAGASNPAIEGGMKIAASMEPIATTADAWDRDPWALCCENGVVDLRTGQLHPGRPEELISRSTGIDYDPDATCPRWERFLAEVFAGDDELVDWIGLLVGASAVGIAKEVLAGHHGLGNNGKSKFTDAIRGAFGEYAVVIPVETLVSAKRSAGEATPDLIPLRGARLAFTSESDQTAKLRGGVLKRMASIDQMTGRPLYGQTQTWAPTHTVHLATNHLPSVDDATDGFWRRMALVPWNRHFRKPGEAGDDPPEDPRLGEVLAAERQGILAWAVRYAVVFAGGRSLHPFPKAVRVKTEDYRQGEDKLAGFLTEKVIYEKDAEVRASPLFAAYREWAEASEVAKWERLGQKVLLREFEERGHVVRVSDHAGRVTFHGARLRLSTESGECGVLGTSDGTPYVGDELEKSGNSSQTATNATSNPRLSPESGGEDVPVDVVDLTATALSIFGDVLVDAPT